MKHALLFVGLLAVSASAAPCEMRSGAIAPVVIELYTSEGCNSCPIADRWLSSLKGRADVVPLAFHVDYWDRLGWVDRFASPAYTERQRRQRASSGATFIYTPQVLANGVDWRRWPALPSAQPSAVDITLRRDSARIETSITPRAGAPKQLAAYWAVTEDNLVSAVKAGENVGVTLHHDHVVRHYGVIAPWHAMGPQRMSIDALPAAPGRRFVLVVTDALGQRPIQALSLGC